MNNEMETRSLTINPTINDDNEIEGTAVVFNQRSEDLGGFDEVIEPTALDGVDTSDVVLLYNHQSGNVLARSSANTLSIFTDEQGVHFKAKLPNTTLGNDVKENLRNGNVRGMSFGFTIAERQWEKRGDKFTQHVKRIGRLLELSLTPFPAYESTDVQMSARSLCDLKSNDKELLLEKEWFAIQKEFGGI